MYFCKCYWDLNSCGSSTQRRHLFWVDRFKLWKAELLFSLNLSLLNRKFRSLTPLGWLSWLMLVTQATHRCSTSISSYTNTVCVKRCVDQVVGQETGHCRPLLAGPGRRWSHHVKTTQGAISRIWRGDFPLRIKKCLRFQLEVDTLIPHTTHTQKTAQDRPE